MIFLLRTRFFDVQADVVSFLTVFSVGSFVGKLIFFAGANGIFGTLSTLVFESACACASVGVTRQIEIIVRVRSRGAVMRIIVSKRI